MPTTNAGLTILVVDDSRPDLVLMTALLTKMGHVVVQANSAEAGLEIFRNNKPDMVLMDVIMPGMGGFAAVREMRLISQDDWIPIIFITGLGQEDDIVQGIEAGGDDFVLKPIHFQILHAKINSLRQHLDLFRGMGEQRKLLSDYQVRNEEELQAAQEFMGRLLALDKINDPLVNFYLQPAEVFSGDLIAVARTPAGHLYAILADSTGHGLTAALAVMPVLQSFYAMVAKGYSIGALAAEINRKIREYLPANRFVAAVLIALDPKNGRVSVWNGGCPPAVLLNPDGMVAYQFDSKHLPLGILNPNNFDDEVTHYHYGNHRCQILLCSDGAIDSADPGSMKSGLNHLLEAAHTDIMVERLPGMIKMLEHKLAGKRAHDDIALIMLDCPAEDQEELPLAAQSELIRREVNQPSELDQQAQREHVEEIEWQFDLVLTAPQLRQADIVPLLLNVVNQIEIEGNNLSGKLFLILSELFNNALDHGLLKLDSTLKHDPQGMDRYFEERSTRLKQLERGEIRIKVLKISTANGPCLKVTIRDTGEGFDYTALHAAASLDASMRRHGRGIALVESLSSQLVYADGGKESQVLISLQND
jgi:CheY-like chemotaxis protein/anti-sigma regulatory factor (Ser/Thr protein kinase)